MENRIKTVLADVLKIDPASINGESSMDTVGSWDSLAQIALVTALEKEFGLTFKVDDLETMTSYADIVDVLIDKV